MADKPQPFKMRERVKLSDLNERFPAHVWIFWSNPNQQTFIDLFAPWELLGKIGQGKVTEEERADCDRRYYAAVAEIVLDTGESKIDLSTPELVQHEIDTQPDAALLGGVIALYGQRLMLRLNEAKKKADEPSSNSATGGNS